MDIELSIFFDIMDGRDNGIHTIARRSLELCKRGKMVGTQKKLWKKLFGRGNEERMKQEKEQNKKQEEWKKTWW